jgi:hypothetical protein
LIKKFPKYFLGLERTEKEEKAVEFCSSWKKERDWCISENLDIE